MESSPSEQHRPPRLGPRSDRLTSRQQELLEHLEAIIVEEGFRHLTVGSLASRLHCSRRTLYDLAPTKAELVLVVLDRRLRRTGRLAREQIAAVDDPADKVDAYLIRSGLRPTSLRFAEDVAQTPAARRLFADHYRFAMAMLGSILKDGMASGRIRRVDTIVIAEIIDAALERLSHPDVLRATGRSFFEISEELSLLVRFGLVAETPPRPRRRGAGE